MPSRLQARAKNSRGRWLTVMGFGAQAPNEGRGADGPNVLEGFRVYAYEVQAA